MKCCDRGHQRPDEVKRCAICHAVWKRARRLANPDSTKAKDRAWYARNRVKKLAQNAARVAADPHKEAARVRAWRQRNYEWHMLKVRAWQAANPDKVKEIARRRVAELTQDYLAGLIGLPVKEVPHDLLEMKRDQLLVRRMARQLKEAINESSKESR